MSLNRNLATYFVRKNKEKYGTHVVLPMQVPYLCFLQIRSPFFTTPTDYREFLLPQRLSTAVHPHVCGANLRFVTEKKLSSLACEITEFAGFKPPRDLFSPLTIRQGSLAEKVCGLPAVFTAGIKLQICNSGSCGFPLCQFFGRFRLLLATGWNWIRPTHRACGFFRTSTSASARHTAGKTGSYDLPLLRTPPFLTALSPGYRCLCLL